jgi:subtilisin family serine protease
MERKARRRPTPALRLEVLEARTLLSGASPGVHAPPGTDPAGDLLVRFVDGVPPARRQATLDAVGGRILGSLPDGPILVGLAPGVDGDAALGRLRREPGVRYAEPDASFRAAEVFSNDPSLASEWGLNNANDIDIDAPQAWDVTTGNPETIVAVLDTGIDAAHPDLASNLWVNPREVPGNGSDDDGNGLIDDVHGWNYLTDTADLGDDNGHGSHVAGTIAAAGDNGLGVVGVAWGARIMPLKILNSFGDGTTYAVVAAIHYAVDNGARIINASWGGASFSQAVADAIQFAGARGVVFVTAAGNEAVNNSVVKSYPASYRFSNVISVAAIDSGGALAGFSNYGRQAVDLAAPGVGILSTVPGGGYATFSGTSMATPHVSGVVALLVAQHPEYSAAQLVQRVLGTTKPLSGAAARTKTGGLVDAAGALGLSIARAFGHKKAPRRLFVPKVVHPRRLAARTATPTLPAARSLVASSAGHGTGET